MRPIGSSAVSPRAACQSDEYPCNPARPGPGSLPRPSACSYQFWRGLSIVLLLTCGYAGYREYERYYVVATTPTVAVTSAPPAPIPVAPPKVEIPPLNPLPKSVLKEKDIAYTFKNSTIQNQTADSVVNLIFAKNKTDITSIYGNQKPAYKAELIKRNPECFKDDKVICTSLKNIPSAK